MIATVPAETAVTRPVDATVAIPGDELDHVTVRPVSGLPRLSFGTAVAWVVCLIESVVVGAVTTTDAGGSTGAGVTLSASVPLLPSLVAVMTADPEATAVTWPDAETVATDVLELDQAIVRPVSVLPDASFKVTVNACDCPATIEVDVALRETLATRCVEPVMTRAAELDTPSLVAVMLTDPAAKAETTPEVDTVASAGAPLVQVMVRPVTTVPAASAPTLVAAPAADRAPIDDVAIDSAPAAKGRGRKPVAKKSADAPAPARPAAKKGAPARKAPVAKKTRARKIPARADA